MPLQWAIDHAGRTVVATGADAVCLTDLKDYLEGMARSATLSYRKLLNLTHCSLALSKHDLVAFSEQVKALGPPGTVGPAALVVASDEAFRQMLFFETLTSARRPLKIFRETHDAQAWLASQRVKPRSLSHRKPAKRRAAAG